MRFSRNEPETFAMSADRAADSAQHRVAIFGATGLVGRTLLRILEERQFPVAVPRLLASDAGGSRQLAFRGQAIDVEPIGASAFDGVEIALFAVGAELAAEWAPVARTAGARVVDNSSAFRLDERVPLVVPEVNGAVLEDRPMLVANPNCSTIALVVALAPLAREIGIERVVVSTYQSASGAGAEALAALERGVRAPAGEPNEGSGPPLAFNVVPHIDRFEANGYTKEEMKVILESRKILALPELAITATAVRVPVRVGHSAAVNVRLAAALSPAEARALWRRSPGIEVVDDPEHGRYPMPRDAEGRDEVLIGRVRRDESQANGLDFFVVSDNLRKGAALNAVQIAERLCRVEVST